MSGFAAIALVLTAAASLWVVRPLLRRPQAGEVEPPDSGLAAYRLQLAELDADLTHGLLSAEQHALARVELERRVLEQVAADAGRTEPDAKSGRLTAVALMMLIPLSALLVHGLLSEPAEHRPADAERRSGREASPDMLARLAARLEKTPDDARGWQLLARSYAVMERLPEAVAAYQRAVQLVKDDPDLYADFADTLAASRGRRIDDQALELVERALRIAPNHVKALALAGTAALDRKDFRGAIAHWERVLPLLPADSALAVSVAAGIAEARALGGLPAAQPPAPPAAAVTGRVTLSPGLLAMADPNDTLFIVARAAAGPRMPLAVVRLRAADLPVDFALSDAHSMTPENKLSGFTDVVLSARISRSGGPLAQSGDLQGSSPPVKTGAAGIAIVIDSVVP